MACHLFEFVLSGNWRNILTDMIYRPFGMCLLVAMGDVTSWYRLSKDQWALLVWLRIVDIAFGRE